MNDRLIDLPVLLPPPHRVTFGRRRFPPREPETALEAGHRSEGYRLVSTEESVLISASDPVGLARGRTTLAQLTGPAGTIEAEVTDWPDFPVRGLMLDISRDKVPTMDTFRSLIDLMEAWKLNHLQLYTEHTFAYRDHPTVWVEASPLRPAEISELRSYCAERHIDLAANQNCLGHMERWLCQERYRPMAIRPDVSTDDRGRVQFPTTLDPGRPESLQFVRGLLAELLPNFDGASVNVGLDEPWELPESRAGDYGAFVASLRAAPELDGREMLIWGDIIARHPELVGGIPDGVTVLEWGYEADHPYEQRAAVLSGAGQPFWVCPGTSSWNSVLGRWTNSRDNCLRAARTGLDQGAGGYLITDWGDHGHLQPLSVSLPGLAVGAAAAWNAGGSETVDFVAALSGAALDAEPLGPDRAQALIRLGDAHRAVTPQTPNMASVLLHLLYPRLRVGQRSTEGLDRLQLDAYEHELDAGLRAATTGRAGGGLVGEELTVAVGIARLGVADARARLEGDGSLASVGPGERSRLADRLGVSAEEHRRLWTRRNRVGGRRDSVDRLAHLGRCYQEGRGRDFVPSWVTAEARPESAT